jgi:hypothetical protein
LTLFSCLTTILIPSGVQTKIAVASTPSIYSPFQAHPLSLLGSECCPNRMWRADVPVTDPSCLNSRSPPNDVILQSFLFNVGYTQSTMIEKRCSSCLCLATLIPSPEIFIIINNKSNISLFCISNHLLQPSRRFTQALSTLLIFRHATFTP